MFLPYAINVPDTSRFASPIEPGTPMGASARSSGNDPWLFETDTSLDSATSAKSADEDIAAAERAEAAANRAFSAAEAEKAREWQEYYERNKYSWAMDGLRSAGLNPILAYQLAGGGSASSAVGQPSKADIASAYSAEYNRIVGESANTVRGVSSVLSLIAVLGAVLLRSALK